MTTVPADLASDRGRILRLVAASVPLVLGVSILVGDQMAGSPSLKAVILPVGAAVGILLLVLAYAHFEAFVLMCLGMRSLVDLAHPGSGSGDHQQSGMAAAAFALLFTAAALVWLLAERRTPDRRPHSAITATLIAFVATCALSVATSARPTLTLIEATRVLACVLMFVVLERLVADRDRAARVLVACFCAAVVPVALGYYQAVTGNGTVVVDEVARIRGSFVHPNDLGFYTTQVIVMGAALCPHVSRRMRPTLLVLLLACAGVLVFTYSRGNWLAALVGLAIVSLLQNKKLIVLIAMAALAVYLAVPSVAYRVTSVSEQRTARGTAGNTLVWRLDHWRELLAFGNKNPVTGLGMKMTEYSTESNRPPHNDFLKVYLEAGILGLAAYLAVLAALARAAAKALRTSPSGLGRGVAVGFVACLAAMVVESIGGNVVGQVAALWYFFAFAAVGSAPCLRTFQPAAATDREIVDEAVNGATR